MSVQKDIGEKIRLFRKLRKMSLSDLAARTYKSKSILSKYELGESSFDMDTLYKIAEALDVEPAQFLVPRLSTALPNCERHGIFENNVLYTYMLVRDRSYHLLKSLLVFNGDAENTASLYMQVPDFDHYTDCKVLYTGQLTCHPNNAFIHLVNQADPSDHAVISVAVRMGNLDTCLGLVMMSGYATNDPGALKFLLAKSPITNEQELIQGLTISRDDIASTKNSNIFTYRLSQIDQGLFWK